MRRRCDLAAFAVLVLAATAARVAAQDLPMYSIEGRRSGYTYLSADTRAQQDDEFSNLGMLWVEQGQRLWSVAESNGKSCVGCHGPVQAMRGVAARYPAYDAVRQRVINLEQRINACRVKHQQATPFAYESQELLAIAALIGRQSRGLPVTVKIDGLAAQSYERGRTAYYQQRGQLGLSCAQCHQQHAGSRLRGELISQGQINGHPVYRQLWQTMGSTHRMFAWCNEAVRAEPYVYGSQEYVDLELFVKWLGRGLPVETPAIRR